MLSPVAPAVFFFVPRRVVNEGIERVEQDRVAMAAARMKQMASGGGGVAVPLLAPLEEAEEGTREDSPDPAQVCVCVCVCVCEGVLCVEECLCVWRSEYKCGYGCVCNCLSLQVNVSLYVCLFVRVCG